MEGPPLSILAIDDNEPHLEILNYHLKHLPHWTVKFRGFLDFEAAWETILTGDWDVLFVDYLLGDNTGIDVLRKLRKARCPQPVILLTAHGDEEIASGAMRAGASDYLLKSAVSVRSLTRSITNALEKARLEREVNEYQQYLEQMNHDLLQRNLDLEDLYYALSHELKTPLTVIREFVSLVILGEDGALNDEQAEHLRFALDGCEQLQLYIEDLIEMTRMKADQLVLSTNHCHVEPWVRRAVIPMTTHAEQKGIDLSYEVHEELPKVCIDEHRVAQVLAKLVHKAIHSTPEGGQISVSVQRSPDHPDSVLVQIDNTGFSIEEDHLDELFERLYELRDGDRFTQEGLRKGGAKLGLKVCKDIIDLHGGRIWAESANGEGSTFFFTVPTGAPGQTQANKDSEEEETGD